MKTSYRNASRYYGVLGMAVALTSSCSSVDPDYAEGSFTAVVADTGPDSVTPVGVAAQEPFETVAPEPTPVVDSKPVAYVAMSPVRSRTIEPTIDEGLATETAAPPEHPEPVVASRSSATSNKKSSGLLSLFGKKKARETETAAYVPYSGPVPEEDVAPVKKFKPATSAKKSKPEAPARQSKPQKPAKSEQMVASVTRKPAAQASPKPAAAKQRTSTATKKKYSGDFISWLNRSR